MNIFRHIITTAVCSVVSFVAIAGEQAGAQDKCAANQPVAVELQRLQGTWQGVMVGQEKDGPVTITITGNSLHFHRDPKFWFKATFTQPAGTDLNQLHATIKDSAPEQKESVGKGVVAIYKIEDRTLTLVPLAGGDEETPKSFKAIEDKGLQRYELRKVEPQKKSA